MDRYGVAFATVGNSYSGVSRVYPLSLQQAGTKKFVKKSARPRASASLLFADAHSRHQKQCLRLCQDLLRIMLVMAKKCAHDKRLAVSPPCIRICDTAHSSL